MSANRRIRVGLLVLALGLALAQGRAGAELVGLTADTLANGLHVIYAPLRNAPVVHVRVVYHVGSRDERADRRGFAHLFEHMMFRGSAHVGPADHVRLIRRVGGFYNGETGRDITSYEETLPRDQLAMALWLEADRMASLKVSPEAFRIERDVVLHELAMRRQELDRIPVDELLMAVYRTHPYRFMPMGNAADVSAADVGELEAFFEKYYVPNNATLVITGDFETAAAREMVKKYFGWMPGGAKIERASLLRKEPPQNEARSSEIFGQVSQPVILVGCRVPTMGSVDDAAIAVLNYELQTRLARYLRINAHPLCSQTFSDVMWMEDGACLWFGGALLAGRDVESVRQIITTQLELLRTEGVLSTEAHFASVVDELVGKILRERETAGGLAEQVVRGAVLHGDGNAELYMAQRLRKLTAPQVMSAAQKYLGEGSLTFVTVRPEGAGAEHPAARRVDKVHKTSPSGAAARQMAFPADYPTTAPVASETTPVVWHRIGQSDLGGIRLMLVAPWHGGVTNLRIIFPRGWRDDPPGKEGIGQITMGFTMDRADTPERDREIGMPLHAPFEFRWEQAADYSEIVAAAPLRNAGQLVREINLALCDVQNRDPFEIGLSAAKWKLLNEERELNERARDVAEREMRSALFGDSSLARRPSVASLRGISSGDVTAWRRRLFNFQGSTIIIGADMTMDQARELVAKLVAGWKTEAGGALASDAPGPAAQRQRPRIILIDDPDSHESYIRLGWRAIGRGSDQALAAELGQWIISQRVFGAVRNEQGYAYDVQAAFESFRGAGMFSIATETSVANTGATLSMLLENCARLGREEPAAGELADSKLAYGGRAVTEYQTTEQQARWRAMAMMRSENPDMSQRVAAIQPIQAAAIQALFAKYLNVNQSSVIVIAPASAVRSRLEQFGDVEAAAMPNKRPGAATRPVYEELPRSM